jgi:hypothetical protein
VNPGYWLPVLEEHLAAAQARQTGGGGTTLPPAAAASPAAPESPRTFERAPTPIHTPEGFAAAWESTRGELPAGHPLRDYKPAVAPWHPADPLNPANQSAPPAPSPWWLGGGR